MADDRVRALALDLLRDPTATWFTKGRAVDLLIRNYTPDDAMRSAECLAISRDRDEFHAIGVGALDILHAHPTTAGVPALLALYEEGPCSNCRGRALAD